MGGVREGEKTSHHALQDRPNRFPCGELGIRIRRWLAALACGSKRHPSLPPPHPGGPRAEDLGSAPSQLRSGGLAQGCEWAVWRFERPRSRPFCTPSSWRSEPSYAGRFLRCICSAATRTACSYGTEVQAAAWFGREMFTRFHPQNIFLKRLHYQQENGQARHSKDSTA